MCLPFTRRQIINLSVDLLSAGALSTGAAFMWLEPVQNELLLYGKYLIWAGGLLHVTKTVGTLVFQSRCCQGLDKRVCERSV